VKIIPLFFSFNPDFNSKILLFGNVLTTTRVVLPYPEEAEIKVSFPAGPSLRRFSKAGRENSPWRGFGIYSLVAIRGEVINVLS
jgi:hypothetical protein